MTDSLATKEHQGLFYGWIIVGACLIIATVIFGSLFTFGVFLNPFRESFGWTSAAVSGAYSLCLLCYTGFGMLSGWGVDRFGPKKTTIVGGVIIAIGLLSASRVNSIWHLYVTYGLIGVGASVGYVPLTTTVSRWFSQRRGLALGIYSTGLGLGPLLGAPVASYIISTSSWRVAYLILAATTGIIIVAALLLKRSPEQIGEVPDGGRHGNDTSSPQKAVNKAAGASSGLSLRQAMGTRAFWLLCSMYLMTGIGIQMVMAHVVAYSQSTGMLPITAATVLSTLSGASVAGRLIMGTASDWIGRKWALVSCLVTEGIMIFWLIGSSYAWMLFLFGAIYGFAYGGHSPNFPALLGETLGLRHMGKIIGVAAFCWGMGAALGPLLAGYILDTTGSYTSAFLVGALGMLTAATLTLTVKRPASLMENSR